MHTKKILLLVMSVVMVWSSCAFADDAVKVGVLSKLNMTPEEFNALVADAVDAGKTKMFSLAGPKSKVEFVFYDSLVTLQMALNKGEVDEIALPVSVAEYMLNTNSDYEIASITRSEPTYLSFGFNKKSEDPELRNQFNEALLSMKADGTLAIIISKLIIEPGIDIPDTINFIKYNNTDTVKVAITGDLPPIDYVAPDGKASGFNVAVLAEISRRLHINVELVNIDAGARAAALASGRADVVFWFQSKKGDLRADVPEGVVLSESYFSWNEILHIKKK